MDVKVYLPTKDEDVPPMKIAVPQMDGNNQPVVNQQGQPILIEQESSNAKNLRWLFGFLALIVSYASTSSCSDSSAGR